MEMAHTFVKGQPYIMKLTFNARRVTYFYMGIRNETYNEPTYHFTQQENGCGNNLWLLDEHIETAEIAVPKKAKARKLQTCNRCYGAGKFEHVAHVQGGICFKCGGAGKI